MTSITKTHATSSALTWALLVLAVVVHPGNVAAEPVGTVTKLSNSSVLLAKKSDNSAVILKQGSKIDNGDMLESQKETYAEIQFIDESVITLGPNTQFKVDNYSYNKDKPNEDRSLFSLIAGTLRSVTGKLGHRNNSNYQLKTPAATIGIRGTIFLARYTPENTEIASETNGMEKADCAPQGPGLFLKVVEGAVSLTKDNITQDYEAGQYGCAALSPKPLIILSDDPDIQFNPSFGKNDVKCSVK